MILPDVNVLVYAHRKDAVDHEQYRDWLDDIINDDQAFGISDLVLSGFVRVVTHPRIFKEPTPLKMAVAFAETLRGQPHAVLVGPGGRHWDIFTRLCHESGVKGNLVADAYLAAMAIESGCEWVTTDGDFGRFRGLRWRHPLR